MHMMSSHKSITIQKAVSKIDCPCIASAQCCLSADKHASQAPRTAHAEHLTEVYTCEQGKALHFA